MKKTICVINGKGGVGKDTLIKSISDADDTFVYNCSSIDPFRDVCAQFNKSGEKDLEYRKFLAGMKSLVDDYCEKTNFISYSQEYLQNELKWFMNECGKIEEKEKDTWDCKKTQHAVMFVHIREPYNIEEFIDRAKRELTAERDRETQIASLLVKSDRAKERYGNAADDMVENYTYNFVYTSKGDIEEDARQFKNFFLSTLENRGVEMYDRVIYDNDRDDFIVGKTNAGDELHVQYKTSDFGTEIPSLYAVSENGQISTYVKEDVRRKVVDAFLTMKSQTKNKADKERE